MSYLYEQINRVPKITDKQIAEMRHIEPVLESNGMYRRIAGISGINPRNMSCLWEAMPVGDEFTFGVLDTARILTQHHSCVFFKPSLAEVYSWIRVYMPETWPGVRFFHLGEARRISGQTEVLGISL